MSNDKPRPLSVFISYASEDEAHRVALEKSLKMLAREGLIEIWSDRKILPGGRWGDEIDAALESADLVVCLLSIDFLASDYCYEIEMKRALERDAAGEAVVVPIVADACEWQRSPLGELQALPDRARPVALWENQAEAWTSVTAGLRRIVSAFGKRPGDESRPPGAGLRRGGSEPDPTRYLEALRDKNAYINIRGLGAQVSERMELRQVYTRLQVSGQHDEREKTDREIGRKNARPKRLDDGHRDRELRDVLAANPRAVLVGDPGSGKTTFLRYVAVNLARAQLGDPQALGRVGLEQPPAGSQAPFPVLVRLGEVAHFLDQHPDPDCRDDAPEHFSRYLEHELRGSHYGLPEAYLRRRVAGGGCFVMLDGLDEVPGEARRERMAHLIERVILEGARSNRYLLTCRTRAYEGLVRLGGGITTLLLAPLQRAQVEQFCDGWCRALYRVGRDDTGSQAAHEADAYRKDLLEAIDANPAGHTFTESPLMLTVLAVVHWNQKQLPEQRAELYDNAIEYLLASRRDLARHETPIRRECLQAIAIAMFEDAEGVQRSLGRAEAAQAVQDLLGIGRDEALAFVENEEIYSGVVVCRIEGEVEFWHLIFQEYLAALELAQAEDGGWQRIAGHLDDDRWIEVVLLLAGCRRRLGGIRAARRMIEKILATGTDRVAAARAVALVARILRDILPYGGDPSDGTDYRRMLNDTLGLFEAGGEAVEERVRVEVGEALGQAGDPRLQDDTANRVTVPGGTFLMGAQNTDPEAPGYDPEAYDDEAPVHEVTVSALQVGRYPVTVTQYARFVDSGGNGYLDPRHWNAKGWAWRENEGIETPAEWAEQLDHPNRPVVNVSWYEADAYCRWVGGRLPTEAEWEWLARGESGRKYPWGDDPPTDRHANFEMSIGVPAPVGIYPEDAGNVRDLAGNVLEWCASRFDRYQENASTDQTGSDGGGPRVLRGGAFYSQPRALGAAYRSYAHPENRYDYVGFRVVWSLPGGQH